MNASGKKLDASTVDEEDPDSVPDCLSLYAIKDRAILNRSIFPYISIYAFPQFCPIPGLNKKSFSFFYGSEAAGR